MQNFNVKETIQMIKKTKSEANKELEELIANGKRNENADMQKKVDGCTTNKDAAKVIQEFEDIIKNKKGNIIWLAYYEGKIFQKFKEKERFVSDMVLKFKASKSTIMFNIS